MARKLVGMVMVLGMGLTMAWAQAPPAPEAGKESKPEAKKLVFAFIPKMLNNPVFNFAKIAAEKEAKAQGDIEILWKAPKEGDAPEQAKIVESLIRKKVDGIAISCNEPSVLKQPINNAIKAGIPVITWDSDSPESDRITFFGIDDHECGVKLAENLVKTMGPKGTVAVLTGVRGATNLEARIKGAEEVLSKYPDIKIIQTYACDDDVPKSVSQIQAAMRAHADLGGWIMVGGWPLFTKGALDPVPPACKVVCVDALPEQWPYLEQKKVEVLIAQKIYGWGSESVKILKAIKAGKKFEKFTNSGMDLVTPDNLAQYKAQWKEWFGQ